MKDQHFRYCPDKKFPAYIFIPGKNAHPKKEGGHMENEADPIAETIDRAQPAKHDMLRWGLDLYNFGYFWESHVYFEAIWNAHGRKGAVADFLKGLIKLGAAGVKMEIGEPNLAAEHFARARELFLEVQAAEGKDFLGFDLGKLSTLHSNERVDPSWS